MHILYLTSGFGFGGAQNIIVGLAKKAIQTGHDVSFLSITDSLDYPELLEEDMFDYHSLEYEGRFKPQNFFTLLNLRRLLQEKINEIGPDVIHEHLFIPKILLYGLSSNKMPPILQTQHDNSPWWFREDFKSKLMTHIEKKFAQKTACKNVAISNSVRKDLVNYQGLDSNEIPRVYNFVNINFSSASKKIDNKTPVKIFMLTRLIWDKKGLGAALSVIERLHREGENIRFIVVGDGKDYDKMVNETEDLNLDGVTEFRGFQQDVEQQLNEADILLMPSQWEGFGITAAEAAARGVPVVASEVGGLQEVVIDGKTGFTCPPDDIDCFVESIKRLLQEKKLYGEFSKTAIKKAKERFSLEKAYKHYENLYQEVKGSK
ncbi:glycosyltransferase family 4 protein [Fodinibius sp. AD559]|uniref:glycosyltransferase family 4 protein n=1 Tax=Fodinibius sp. AD559 TaxID=3424179 RepID=UPI004046B999